MQNAKCKEKLLTKKFQKIMKKLFYTAPEVMAYEVVAERGYENSTSFGLPEFGTDTDDWA